MISRGPRRSTAVEITATAPTRVRSSSTDAAPMVARGTVRRLRSSKPCGLRHTEVAAAAPDMISRGLRRSTAVATTATVPTRVRSSGTDAAPMIARGTVRHLRSSSQPPTPSVALAGTRGMLAAIDRR